MKGYAREEEAYVRGEGVKKTLFSEKKNRVGRKLKFILHNLLYQF